MPITPFLNGRYFDADTKRVMGLAFEMTCVSLRLADGSDPICNIIAEKIVALAQKGERDPNELCMITLSSLGSVLHAVVDDPKHWQARAEEARTMAVQVSHPQSSDALLRIADDYERLAEHAERRAKLSVMRDAGAARMVHDTRQPQ